jgi:hypothetical protein
VLCDAPAPVSAYGIRINGAPVLQVAQLFRGTAPRVFNRGNRAFTMSFSAFRGADFSGVEFPGFAHAFIHGFDTAAFESFCPHFGLIRIEVSDGSTGFARFIDRAGLQEIGGIEEIIGAGLTQRYQIIGGTPLAALPVTT